MSPLPQCSHPPGLPRCWRLGFLFLLAAVCLWAAKPPPEPSVEPPDAAYLEALLASPRASLATLSRDGQHLAYVVTAGVETRIELVATQPPYDKTSCFLGNLQGGRILQLAWTSPTRVVFAAENWTIGTVAVKDPHSRIVLDAEDFATDVPLAMDDVDTDNLITSVRYPRPPRLLGLWPDAPDQVVVEGVAGRDLESSTTVTARLDLTNGDWQRLDDARITQPAVRYWSDPLGRYRLQEDRTRLPLRWSTRKIDAKGRARSWQPLAKQWPDDLVSAFTVDNDRLWTERAFPLGFSPDSERFYFATNVGRDTYGLRAWDTVQQRLTDLRVDLPGIDIATPHHDLTPRPLGRNERNQRQYNAAVYYTEFQPDLPSSPLIFDRASGQLAGLRLPSLPAGAHWLDPALVELQTRLARDHPGRRVELLDWDDARETFAVNVSAPGSAGRYYVYHRSGARWVEMLTRETVPQATERQPVEMVTIESPDGSAHSARLTHPRQPLGRKPPVVFLLGNGPWSPAATSRSGPAQMLGAYGCFVVELDLPGRSGQGLTALLHGREDPPQTSAANLDRILDWLKTHQSVDARRLALVGEGYGAWLALRVAELRPGVYRSVVSLNGLNDPGYLFAAKPERVREDDVVEGLRLAHDMMDYMDAVKRDLDRLSNLGATGDEDTSQSPITDTTSLDSDAFDTNGFIGGSGSTRTISDPPERTAIARRMSRQQEVRPVSQTASFARWYFGRSARDEDRFSVKAHVLDLHSAVLLAVSPEQPGDPAADARTIARAMRHSSGAAEIWELPLSPWSQPLSHRPETWRRVLEFFNETLIDFDVQIGPTREVP